MCELTESDSYIAQLRKEHAVSDPIKFKWPERLAPPVDPMDTWRCARAQSLLTGPEFGVCPPLAPHQAVDVLRWAGVPA